MATHLAKTPLVQIKRQLAAQAAVAIQQAEAGITPAKVRFEIFPWTPPLPNYQSTHNREKK